MASQDIVVEKSKFKKVLKSSLTLGERKALSELAARYNIIINADKGGTGHQKFKRLDIKFHFSKYPRPDQGEFCEPEIL